MLGSINYLQVTNSCARSRARRPRGLRPEECSVCWSYINEHMIEVLFEEPHDVGRVTSASDKDN